MLTGIIVYLIAQLWQAENKKNAIETGEEMETAAIYGLGQLMGHHCLSLNAIIANRASGTFSEDPYKAVDELIAYALEKLAE